MKITNDIAHHQFVADVAGGKAKAIYALSPGVLEILSVQVPPEAQGQGIAGELVAAALQSAKDQGLKIVPTCPYVGVWFDRHPNEKKFFKIKRGLFKWNIEDSATPA